MSYQQYASIGFSYVLLAGSALMFGWGVVGFLEYCTGIALIMPLQNPAFPSGTQFLHWLLLTSTGGVYLMGYALRWKHLPVAMLVLFAMLATLCAVQTFDFLQGDDSWGVGDFVRELMYYCVISLYLFHSEHICSRLGQ